MRLEVMVDLPGIAIVGEIVHGNLVSYLDKDGHEVLGVAFFSVIAGRWLTRHPRFFRPA